MDDQAMAPTLRERASSTAITLIACVLVAAAATLVLGLGVWFLQVAFGIKVPLEAGVSGSSAVALRPANVAPAAGSTGFGIALWLAVVIMVWLTACRGGIGTPGDAVMTLRPYDTSGTLASRGRNLLRGAVPVGAFAVVAQVAVLEKVAPAPPLRQRAHQVAGSAITHLRRARRRAALRF